MLSLPPGTKVYLASKPVDMRKGFAGLSVLASEVFRLDPYSGHVFLFRSKRGNYLKALVWDGTGLCLFAKLARFQFVQYARSELASTRCDAISPAPALPVLRGRAGLAGACGPVQVRRPPAALAPVADLRPRRRRAQPLDAG